MKDDASIIAEMQDDIRRLKGRPDPGGFEPIGAAVYAASYLELPHTGPIKWRPPDLTINELGDASFGLRAGQYLPPDYEGADGKWMEYIWYDDGFGADTGTFTIPEDGVYLSHARMYFQEAERLESIAWTISFNPLHGQTITVGYSQLFQPQAQSINLPLDVYGVAYMDAGSAVHLDLDVSLSHLLDPEITPTSVVFAIERTGTPYPPPIEVPLYTGPAGTARWSIQKIGNKPNGGAI